MLFQLGYDEDVIELPLDLHPSLASKFNTTSEPVKVSVRPLSDIPIAEQVCFEPLSTPDWELIEMEASVLEDGGLLNQITVVYPGQIFPLRLGPFGGGDTSYSGRLESAAWIKVAEQGFVSTFTEDDSDETDSLFNSDTDSIDSTKRFQVRYNCLRLMAETEVSVVPKPRTKNKEEDDEDNESSLEETDSTAKSNHPVYGFSCPLRVQGTYVNSTETSHNRTVPDMPPFGCVHVHPSTLKQLPGYQQLFENEISCLGIGSNLPQAIVSLRKCDGSKCDDDESEHAIARICSSEFVSEGHITIHRCLQIQLGTTILSDWLVVQILPESCVIERVARSRELIAQGKKRIKLINSSFGNPELKSSISSTFEDDIKVIIQPNTLFSSGYIIPVSALQSITPPGTDWLDQYCLGDYVTVKLQYTTTDDRTCSDDSQQQLIITGTDLKRFLERKIQDQESTPEGVSVATINSDIIPPFDSYVEGFSSTIDRLTRDISEIVSYSRSCGFATQRNAIMITGDVGSGKTKLALTLASQLFYSNSIGMVRLDCKKLQASQDTTLSSIMKEIQKSCQQAFHKQPSLLILDDLDALIPNSETSDGSGDGSIHHQHANPALVAQTKVIVDYLLRFSRQCKESSVVLVATCRDEDSLNAHYKDSNIFYSSVEVPSLNAHDRTRFLYNYMIGEWPDGDTSSHIPNCISKLGKLTDGFRPHDLKLISTRIRNMQYLRQLEHQTQRTRLSKGSEDTNVDDFNEDSGTMSRNMLESDIASVMEDFTPLSQQSVNIAQNKPSVDWSLVGGLKHAKQCLYDVIIHPVRYKMIYDSSPMSLPTGVLLYGYPGSGKSFIVPALAKASNLSLITCRGPELLDRYIGASEAKVREVFKQAVTAAPCMIFFDEFDSLAPQRGSDHTGVTDRVVNQLLTLLDGAERNKKTSQIYIVAATSRPDKIDKALLRPGRLETHVYFGYPESLIEWEELFCSIVSSWDLDEEVLSLCRKRELYSALCNDLTYARDLSAADMKAVMDTAHLIRVHEMLDESGHNVTESDLPPKVIISKRHMISALRKTRPSLLTEDRVKLQNYYKPFGADGKSTTPETNTRNALNHNLKTSFR